MKEVTVVAGDVHAGMKLDRRVPQVCAAMTSQALLSEGRVKIIRREGPPSGQSTTVKITYALDPAEGDRSATRYAPLLELRGIASRIFEELGGGENFIRREREEFYAPPTKDDEQR